MHSVQNASVSGTLSGKSRKYGLWSTWAPTSSRAASRTGVAASATTAGCLPERCSSSSRDSLKPTDSSATSSRRATVAPSPGAPSTAGTRSVLAISVRRRSTPATIFGGRCAGAQQRRFESSVADGDGRGDRRDRGRRVAGGSGGDGGLVGGDGVGVADVVEDVAADADHRRDGRRRRDGSGRGRRRRRGRGRRALGGDGLGGVVLGLGVVRV